MKLFWNRFVHVTDTENSLNDFNYLNSKNQQKETVNQEM